MRVWTGTAPWLPLPQVHGFASYCGCVHMGSIVDILCRELQCRRNMSAVFDCMSFCKRRCCNIRVGFMYEGGTGKRRGWGHTEQELRQWGQQLLHTDNFSLINGFRRKFVTSA